MGTWLAVEAIAALLSALLWGEPAPSTSSPDCGGVEASEVERCAGDVSGTRYPGGSAPNVAMLSCARRP